MLTIFYGCNNDKKVVENTSEPEELIANPIVEESIATEESETIASIKNSTLSNLPNSLTVGQALDGWQGCLNPEWEDKIGERGETMVVYKCQLSNQDEFLNHPFYGTVDKRIMHEIDKIDLGIIFVFSADMSSFQATSGALIYTFKDKKSYIDEIPSTQPILDVIYRNNYLAIHKEVLSMEQYNTRQ